jgi:hypothetical protein
MIPLSAVYVLLHKEHAIAPYIAQGADGVILALRVSDDAPVIRLHPDGGRTLNSGLSPGAEAHGRGSSEELTVEPPPRGAVALSPRMVSCLMPTQSAETSVVAVLIYAPVLS